MTKRVRIVDTPQCHLWTDALHVRALAHQAKNRWDRGTYARLTVIMACTALEGALREALPNGTWDRNRFRENIDNALAAAGCQRIVWGNGLWQRVRKIWDSRVKYIHRTLDQRDLFAAASDADEAISKIREAIKDIYSRAGKQVPRWAEADEDRGWEYEEVIGGIDTVSRVGVNLTLARAGSDASDAITIKYVRKGREYATEVLAPGTDAKPAIDRLIDSVTVPISAVRVYKGDTLEEQIEVKMRGSD
jgi:hypothetical protein